MEKVYIFTDGSSKNNGRKNCKASSSIYIDNFSKTEIILEEPSNQKAELYAIKMALEYICSNYSNKKVVVVSDSMYSIKCLTIWCYQWVKNGWKTSNGKEVKHQELIKYCLEKIKEHSFVEFLHQKSHQKEPKDENSFEWFLWNGNRIVDKMAQDITKN